MEAETKDNEKLKEKLGKERATVQRLTCRVQWSGFVLLLAWFMLFLVIESNYFLVCLCLGYVGCVMPWVLSVGLFVMISVSNPFFIKQKMGVMKKKQT